MPTALETGGDPLGAAWFVDWHVEPGEKAVGVGLGLLRAAQRTVAAMLTLEGSADTQRILPRLGWQQASAPVTALLPLSRLYITDYARRHVPSGFAALAPLAGQAGRVWFVPRRPPALAGAQLVDVTRFPSDYDEVWAARCAEFAPAMSRTSQYLNYLCADYPSGGYRLQLARLSNAVVGHLVTFVDHDRTGLQRGRIVDLLWPTEKPALLDWMVASACWQLDEAGVDYVLCTASRGDLKAALDRAHFRVRNTVPIWYHRLPSGTPDPERWHITYLDCDRAYR